MGRDAGLSDGGRPRSPRWRSAAVFLVVFTVAVAVGGVFIGALAAPRERRAGLAAWGERLNALAEDRQALVEGWLASGLSDARTVAEYPTAVVLATGDTSPEARRMTAGEVPAERLERLFGSLVAQNGYAGALLETPHGRVLAGTAGGGAGHAAVVAEIVARDRPAALFYEGPGGRRLVAFCAPVRAPGRPEAAGVVLLVSDPAVTLYPLLERDPFKTATLETVLLRLADGEITFLSPGRRRNGPRAGFGAAPGVRGTLRTLLAGGAAFVTLQDDRGERVLASGRPIAGTRWGLVVKVDRHEALASVRHALAYQLALLLASALGLAAAVQGAWLRREVRYQRELSRGRARLGLVLQEANDAILFADDSGVIVDVNEAAETMYGSSREALRGTELSELSAEHGGPVGRRLDELATGSGAVVATRHRRSDGTTFPVEVSVRALEVESSRTLVAIVRDTTMREEATAALRASEERLRSVLQNMPVMLVALDERLNVLVWNAEAERLTGFPASEIVGNPRALELVFPDPGYRAEAVRRWEHLTPDFRDLELRMACRDGSHRDTLWSSVSRRVRIPGWAGWGIGIDITVRRAAEEASREAGQKLEALFRASPSAIVALDPEGNVTAWNDAAERLFGWSAGEVLGRRHPIVPADEWDEFLRLHRRSLAGQGGTGREVERVCKDGTRVLVTVSNAPLYDAAGRLAGAMGVFVDVTQQRLMERQLLHAQRMEAVGRLAGGVAHDFNNLLQAILGLASMLRLELAAAPEAGETIGELEDHVRRGAQLTRQLLLFARRDTARPEILDLNAVVRDSGVLLRRLLRENISFRLDLDEGELPVVADRGQLEQTLMNLVVNAADAMPDGGSLAIGSGAEGEHWVWVAVEDFGTGIPADVIDRVFEPFFTTKSSGGGTGLGLSVVHGIVTRHGGRVELQSTPGEGTTVRVVLPRAEEPAASSRPAPVVLDDAPAGRGEHVLVVEDERAARTSLVRMLELLGYRVTAAACAEEVPDTVEAFDVLLSDILLPGISGLDLARLLRQRRPALKIVLMSGYAENVAVRETISHGGVRFLQKPFSMVTLATELRSALEA